MAENKIKTKEHSSKKISSKDNKITDFLLNNAMYILIVLAVI